MEILPVQAKLNANVKVDLTPAVQATADTISTSHKGIRKLLNAFVGPWIANRERAIALLQAQTKHDCQQIAEGELTYQEGRLLSVPDRKPLPNVYETIHGLNHQADAKRLEAAIHEAARQIFEVSLDQISEEPISQTFFNRWRREAEMIDEKELRQWWAGLLKEEVVQPNRISMRTLDVVKNLSKINCMCFANICRGEIGGELIVSYDNRPIFGSYEDVLEFQDLGLISDLQSAAKMDLVNGTTEVRLRLGEGVPGLRIWRGTLWVHTFSLTNAGRDLIRVVGKKRISADDVKVICKFLSHHNIESCTIDTLDRNETRLSENWKWIRGHRPSCWE